MQNYTLTIKRGVNNLAKAPMASMKLFVFVVWISYGLCALLYASKS